MQLSEKKKEMWIAYLFILPLLLQFVIFTVGPMIFSGIMSFTDWNIVQKASFVGFDNYKNLFRDEKFWKSLYNTVYYMIGIPIGLILAMLLAIGLNRPLKGSKAFRVIFYMPAVCSLVAVAILWQWLLNKDYGLINYVLSWFGIEGPSWLGNEAWIKAGLILMMVWKGVGASSIFYLAGLQNVPKSLYEAAEIDGAGRYGMFRHITFPLLTPMTFFLVITGLIGGFQLFVEVIIMASNGGDGPNNSAVTLVVYMFQKAFNYYEMGYASAMAWVLGIIMFIITFIQFKFQDKWVHE
ncbi:sugar ABC transporter permease [Paenibacillus sp. sptzw28]|uniref:carbohydrate ABC transporter permease n=1 Tax=Paenibacillus sp. sptzw28 TaxID=715179 RepID=UPI001C6EF6B1|nr:sugar ABC transporter permease [Paenibacillus sp. sptzw28]QYR22469.1 sugar ABC transporter permease [Paenibacillus sp. sptzw28]